MEEDLLDDFTEENSSGKRYPKWIIVLLVLFPITVYMGTAVSFYEIKSIIPTGGVLLALSLTLLISGFFMRRYFLVIIAGFGLLAIFSVVFVIAIFELSPTEAEKPVPLVNALISVLVTILYLFGVIRWLKI